MGKTTLLWLILVISATSLVFLFTKTVGLSLSGATDLSPSCSIAVRAAATTCKSHGYQSAACQDAARAAASTCGFSVPPGPITQGCDAAIASAKVACEDPKQNPDACRAAVRSVITACGPTK